MTLSSGMSCEFRGELLNVNPYQGIICLRVASMTRPDTDTILNEYELAVDEIVAACEGDVRSALRVLLTLNQMLEVELERMSSLLIDRATNASRLSIH